MLMAEHQIVMIFIRRRFDEFAFIKAWKGEHQCELLGQSPTQTYEKLSKPNSQSLIMKPYLIGDPQCETLGVSNNCSHRALKHLLRIKTVVEVRWDFNRQITLASHSRRDLGFPYRCSFMRTRRGLALSPAYSTPHSLHEIRYMATEFMQSRWLPPGQIS